MDKMAADLAGGAKNTGVRGRIIARPADLGGFHGEAGGKAEAGGRKPVDRMAGDRGGAAISVGTRHTFTPRREGVRRGSVDRAGAQSGARPARAGRRLGAPDLATKCGTLARSTR